MEFSSLETMTITLLGSVVTAGVGRAWMGRAFVSKETCETGRKSCSDVCELRLQGLQAQIQAAETHVQELERSYEKFVEKTAETQGHIFRMLRAMIVYSDIPADKKQEILNERGK